MKNYKYKKKRGNRRCGIGHHFEMFIISFEFHVLTGFFFLSISQQLQYQIPYQQQAIQYNRPQVAPAAKQTLALSRRPPPSQQINYQTIQQGQSNKDEEEREEDYEVSKMVSFHQNEIKKKKKILSSTTKKRKQWKNK